ncbi:MAG: acetylxylan esterase [Prolixibacteraceae bacterium]
MNKLFKLLIVISLPLGLFAQTKEKPQVPPDTLNQKVDRPINYDEEKVPAYHLPDLLTCANGHKVTGKKEWANIRRPELLELFTTQVFGRVPGTPYQKTIRVVKTDPNAMNGAATLKLIDITIVAQSKSLTIRLGLFTPNKATKPVPAFLLICNRAPKNIDFSRIVKSEFWPAEEVIARGYAVAAFDNADVDPDQDDGFKNGIHGLLDAGRSSESWGTIAAWAWGASRCLDYLVTDKNIAPDKIAVVGHSRGAKTALWAGATDARFAMVACNEAGCGGSSLSLRRFGETIYQINRNFPHWFCGNYKYYGENEDALPFDQHMLLALIAPRPLYVASAEQDLWGDPRGQYLALYHAVPAYHLFETKSGLPEVMPSVNQPVISGNLAYHIRDGKHNLLLKDWNFFMDFADQVLTKK